MRVIVFGATGYIGKATVTELAARGHSIIAVARKDSGIGGKQSLDEVQAAYAELGDVEVVAGDVMDEASVMGIMESTKLDAAVCCLASRIGGRQDAYDIDYRATMNTHKAARACKLRHFVMLSAVCVQRPLLAIQEAKLKAEAEIRESGDELPYSIAQPTAFFKSLLGQLAGVKGGRPYVIFGDGTQVRCKPISEEDLAGFISDCLWDDKKRNQTLPIGGPGPALCFREIGEEIHRNLGREPKFLFIPFSIFDIIQAPLDFLTSLLPEQLADAAEYCRIGRYYAEQSMLVLNKETDTYAPELTPSYGKTSLPEFLRLALEPGSGVLEKQKMGVPQASNVLSMLVGLSDLQKSLGLAPAPPAPAPVEVEEVAKEKEKELQLEEA